MAKPNWVPSRQDPSPWQGRGYAYPQGADGRVGVEGASGSELTPRGCPAPLAVVWKGIGSR